MNSRASQGTLVQGSLETPFPELHQLPPPQLRGVPQGGSVPEQRLEAARALEEKGQAGSTPLGQLSAAGQAGLELTSLMQPHGPEEYHFLLFYSHLLNFKQPLKTLAQHRNQTQQNNAFVSY